MATLPVGSPLPVAYRLIGDGLDPRLARLGVVALSASLVTSAVSRAPKNGLVPRAPNGRISATLATSAGSDSVRLTVPLERHDAPHCVRLVRQCVERALSRPPGPRDRPRRTPEPEGEREAQRHVGEDIVDQGVGLDLDRCRMGADYPDCSDDPRPLAPRGPPMRRRRDDNRFEIALPVLAREATASTTLSLGLGQHPASRAPKRNPRAGSGRAPFATPSPLRARPAAPSVPRRPTRREAPRPPRRGCRPGRAA
jgi:hypothetical protein